MKNIRKKIIIVLAILLAILIVAFIVYDRLLIAPNITISINRIGQQKLDTNFKVKIEVESLSYLPREYIVNLDLISSENKVIPLPSKLLLLEPKKKTPVEFECLISEPSAPGNYTALSYVTAKTSILSTKLEKIVELKQDFVVAEKIVNGVMNLIDIKGTRKVGETLTINVVAKNTGEVAKIFSVDGKIISPKGETFQLPEKEFNLKIEESKKFSYDYSIPMDASSVKYKVNLVLFAGETSDPNKKKLAELEEEILIKERVIKASIEGVKLSGKLKSGETIRFDIDVKNTGDVAKIFSLDTSLTDPSGKTIKLPSKDFQLNVDEVKQSSYEYSIPMTGSHGRYKINVIAYVGAANDLNKRKVSEFQQEFTVAERITKASISDVIKVSSKGKIKVGEVVTIEFDVRNVGELPHIFPVSVSINNTKEIISLPPKKIQMEIGESKTVVFDYSIPIDAPYGTYEVKVSIWNDVDASGKFIEKYDEKVQTFNVGGPTISASTSIISVIGSKKFGESVPIKSKYTNTGEAKHEFFIKLEVIDPNNKVSTILNEKIELDKGETKEKEGDFKIDFSLDDGQYKVVSSIWDKLGDDGLPVGEYGRDVQTFDVIDTPPVIYMYTAVPPVVGKGMSVVAKVKDDKEVRSVVLVYQGPGMTEMAKDLMIRTSGTKKDGSYSATTRRFDYTGTLFYYIEATDSKGQKVQSEKSKPVIK
jgi:hypothetical protein